MSNLCKLQKSAPPLRQQPDTYVTNSDPPDASVRLKQVTHITLPVLLDRQLAWARQYDMLPKPNQPMGMMSGVGQMGFVVIDASGTIRVQRVDIQFGQHAPQILEILRSL